MEPQVAEGAVVPLNPEHEIVKKYLEHESWKKVGVYRQEGKRAVLKVLRFHMSHCLHSIQEPAEDKPSSVAVEAD